MLKSLNWRLKVLGNALAAFIPELRVIALIAMAGAIAYLIPLRPTITLAAWMTRTGSILEILGVWFIFREVRNAHKEAGEPGLARNLLTKIAAFGPAFTGPRILEGRVQMGGAGGFYEIKGVGATLSLGHVSMEAKVAQLEKDVNQVREAVEANRAASEKTDVELGIRIDGLLAQVNALKSRMIENFKKLATGGTSDKLSGAILVFLGLALANASVWVPVSPVPPIQSCAAAVASQNSWAKFAEPALCIFGRK